MTASGPGRRRWSVPPALVAIVAAGVALRVGWSIHAARPPVGLHDPGLYRLFGDQLASGNGYRLPDGSPTAYYPIGYPLALAAAFLLTPDGWQTGAVVAINIACQAAAVVLVFAITRRVCGGRDLPALVAAGAVSLWPNLVLHSAVALSESLFIALVLGAVLVTVSAPWEAGRLRPTRLAAIGGLLGAATLVRPVAVPLVGAVVVAGVVAGFGWRRALGHGAVVAAALVAAQLPWVARNVVVMDAPVVTTNTGDNLCMSRRVGGTGGFEFPNERCNNGPFDALPRPEYEIERDAHGRRLAVDFVQEHAAEELRLVWRRAVRTFESDDDAVAAAESYGDDPFLSRRTRRALQTTANTWYAVGSLAGIAGLALVAATRRPAALVVVLAPIGLLLAPLVFFGDVRFHVPAVPFVAVGVGALVDRLATGRRAPTSG